MKVKNNWLVLATGSNIGDRKNNLELAKVELQKHFKFIYESEIFESVAVGYTNQPDFYNQVLEFEIPDSTPDEVMTLLLSIEKKLGRTREIHQGPRTVDIDIIFWGDKTIKTELVQIPHPRFAERSFVVEPLKQLPCFINLQKYFKIPKIFTNTSRPI